MKAIVFLAMMLLGVANCDAQGFGRAAKYIGPAAASITKLPSILNQQKRIAEQKFRQTVRQSVTLTSRSTQITPVKSSVTLVSKPLTPHKLNTTIDGLKKMEFDPRFSAPPTEPTDTTFIEKEENQ